jgi:hypothetical protein
MYEQRTPRKTSRKQGTEKEMKVERTRGAICSVQAMQDRSVQSQVIVSRSRS